MHFKDKTMPTAILFNIAYCRFSVYGHRHTLIYISHRSLILQGEFLYCLGLAQIFAAVSELTASRHLQR